jgi:hypothetical protein
LLCIRDRAWKLIHQIKHLGSGNRLAEHCDFHHQAVARRFAWPDYNPPPPPRYTGARKESIVVKIKIIILTTIEGIYMTKDNLHRDQPTHSPQRNLDKGSMIRIIMIPLYLLLFAFIGYFIWRLSFNFAIAFNTMERIGYGIGALLLLLIELRLSISIRRYAKRILSITESKKIKE